MLPRFDKAAIEKEVNKRQVLTTIAHDLGCTESQLSLGWLLHKNTSIIPIPATTNIEHLRDNALAATLVIPKTKITEIDNEFPLGTFPPRYPTGFSEIEMDARWIKKYQEIKQEANESKVEMATIRGVTLKALQAYTTNKMNAEFLKQLINSTIDQKTITALSSKNLSECHDGITASSLAVYDARSASPTVATSGKIDKSPDSEPVDHNTKFNIASISKFILMVMTIRLCMKGLLNLDKTLADYLPDIQEITEASSITLRHLLSHHSGLQTGTFKKYMKSQPLSDILLQERVGHPGEKFQYANVNYVLIGKIIEAVTNDSLENQFKLLIGEPLNLNNTYHIEQNMKESNLAEGYKYTSSARLFKADSNNYTWAADGFRSTPTDLTKLSHNFFNNAVFISPNYRDQVIDSIRDVMFIVVTKQNTYRWPAAYGMGLERHHLQDPDAPEKKLTVYGNGGWLNGFAAFLLYSPEQKVSVCFACTKTQGAQKLNLSKLTDGHFFKAKKTLKKVIDSEQKTQDAFTIKPEIK